MNKNWYYRKLLASICILSSSFLLLEHIWRWDGIELLDFIGHEWYAIILFIVAIFLSAKELRGNVE